MEPIEIPNTPVPASLPAETKPEHAAIAPMWHTVALVAILILFSWGNAHADHSNVMKHGVAPFYLLTMIWEWILFFYVWWGIRKRKVTMKELVGGRWNKVEDALIDVLIAVGFWFVALLVLALLAKLLHLTGGAGQFEEVRKQIGFLVPHSATEVAMWVGLCATAGICEEVIFRGYLQRQFAAMGRNVWVGIVLSGICFGSAHGYEGVRRMMLIAVYGMMFGVLAHYRKSLRPGMMAHGLHDLVTGLVLRAFIK